MSFHDLDDYAALPPACEECGSSLELTKEAGWWCQRCWTVMWQTAPTQAEVDKAASAITGTDLASERAKHPDWPATMSDTTVRALLVFDSRGKK